ncbi:MAG: WD40/YVTN/BNR-like repeat-containing protein [Vicinamibacterales bacterium]
MRSGLPFLRVLPLLLLVAGAATAAGEPDTPGAGLANVPWRSIGPANMSGRVTDIAVPNGQSTTVYCATASGGVWKTVNRGTTWTPIFDRYGSGSIGALAVSDSNPDIVWVGTGEVNASSYAPWGDGVYKSLDGGRSFSHMGLADTHHIGRIIIHPGNPDIVYVAAAGHLWGPNPERGLYRTRDGGRTWRHVKFISEDAGFVDMTMDPRDPQVVYAAAYGRRSERFDDFDSVGISILEGSGIYKTTDGGESWTPLTQGLPTRRVGRIGLRVAPSRPDRIYAIVEVAPVWVTLTTAVANRLRDLLAGSDPPDAEEAAGLRRLIEAGAPGEPRSAVVAGMSRGQQAQLRVLLAMPELDTGGGVFRSDDRGRTWIRTSPLNEREGYYSKVRVDPNNPDRVYALMVRTWSSNDGGQSFEEEEWAFSSFLTSDFIHGDFHAMWIDPASSNHLIVGSDGGLYTTYDRGAHWEAHQMPIGQVVRIGVDMRKPYFVYAGLQDNGTWGGPSATRHRSGVTANDWYKVASADGAYTHVDPTNHNLIYTASQNGNLLRIDLGTGARRGIRPRAGRGEPALRFNFTTPVLLSSHGPATLYIAAQRVFRSTNRGDAWTAISPDLTKGQPSPRTGEGATITTLAESPKDPSVLWAGTDDGNLLVTRDGGGSWISLADRLPGAPKGPDGRMTAWVSRVEASRFDAGAAYVSLDAHRDNDFEPHLYRTGDFGQTWVSIVSNLPRRVPVSVIRGDRRNPDLLFAGTKTSVFTSVDGGRSWQRLSTGLPTVPVDDLVIHPREPELVAGTHGRSLYVLDISALQALSPQVRARDAHLFPPAPAVLWNIDLTKNKAASGARRFAAPNPYAELVREGDSSGMAPPGAGIYYYLKAGSTGPARITVRDNTGTLVRELVGSSQAGINRVLWDLRGADAAPLPMWRRVGGNDSRRLLAAGNAGRPGPVVPIGDYEVTLSIGGREQTQPLRIVLDDGAAHP